MMRKTIESMLAEFKNDVLFLSNYRKVDNLGSPDYDPKLTVKIGKRIEKNATRVIQGGGVEDFIGLLSDEHPAVASAAAGYLFPLYPQRCIGLIRRYAKSLSEPLDRKREEDLIFGLENGIPFFVGHFETIYGTDYRTLSRE